MINFKKYFCMDMRRLLKSGTWIVSIIGVAVCLFFSLETKGFVNENVLSTYFVSTTLSGVLITYVFSAFSYAAVFSEDIEHKYLQYMLIRGNLRDYVFSKISVIYISSVLTMVLGTFFFLMLCRMRMPWVNLEIDKLGILVEGTYGSLIEGGHYLGYCMLYALHMGILAGTLSIAAAFCSIFISNRMMIFVIPILLIQLLTAISIHGYNVFIFYAYVKVLSSDFLNLIFILGLSVLPSAILTAGIYYKLKKRL